jgi:hypothetical protein
MVILVADVTCFVMGVTYPFREKARNLSSEQIERMNEINKINSGSKSVSPLP